ncbi:hypothetical protein SMX71_004380, partial [Cronobacter dublinensis]|nr:hypothetical protein [Cronobacter dublinensis]
VQAVAAIGRQRVRRPAVAQLHLQQVTGAVAQRRQLATVREPRAGEVAQRVVPVLRQAVIMPTRPFLMNKSFYGQIKISLFNPLINKMAGIPA